MQSWRQNNSFRFFYFRLFHIFISLICALIFATTDLNMICSKCFQNCNIFLNLDISSLFKKNLVPLTSILPTASAALEPKPDPIKNHIATSRGSIGSSITPLMPTPLESKGNGNNRHWNFGNKSGLRHLLYYHLQHLTNDKQRDTKQFASTPGL